MKTIPYIASLHCQTETSIDLPPGKHKLQLVLGDMYHVPHSNPLISEKITILVK